MGNNPGKSSQRSSNVSTESMNRFKYSRKNFGGSQSYRDNYNNNNFLQVPDNQEIAVQDEYSSRFRTIRNNKRIDNSQALLLNNDDTSINNSMMMNNAVNNKKGNSPIEISLQIGPDYYNDNSSISQQNSQQLLDQKLNQLNRLQLSISIVKSDFNNVRVSQNKHKYKFRMKIEDLITGSVKDIYIVKNYEVILGRKKAHEEFQQVQNKKHDFINLKSKNIQLNQHVKVSLRPLHKIAFQIQDLGSFTGTYVKLDSGQLNMHVRFIIGQTMIYIYDVMPKQQIIKFLVSQGPYKGQKYTLDFNKYNKYYIGKESQKDNVINMEEDSDISKYHCIFHLKRTSLQGQSFFIKSLNEDKGLWMQLNEPRDVSEQILNSTDNCCLMLGNSYKVSLIWK